VVLPSEHYSYWKGGVRHRFSSKTRTEKVPYFYLFYAVEFPEVGEMVLRICDSKHKENISLAVFCMVMLMVDVTDQNT
jgi:hypothetical protein